MIVKTITFHFPFNGTPTLQDVTCVSYSLQDGQGLYLDIRPTGAKIWRYRFWLTPKKDGRYTIGEYPAVSLADARREREWAREQVKQGKNPTSSFSLRGPVLAVDWITGNL
ncbi:Arm DNA-binding domain-containing protein [Enterobacter bugandensis]|uniref:Arm DNA-binding domain-containing protein n=1 Tax=Enterobacter bugandensis TaxID=881260 RepID=UPI002003A6FB|nr:Arm DNA-binding domain-containing protein [Enterobacter bugandensis]